MKVLDLKNKTQLVIDQLENILANNLMTKESREGLNVFTESCPFESMRELLINNKTYPSKEKKFNRECLEVRLDFWRFFLKILDTTLIDSLDEYQIKLRINFADVMTEK